MPSKPANHRFQSSPKKGISSHVNFIEALKSAGGTIASDTAHSLAHDLVGGTAKQMVDSVLGNYPKSTEPSVQETSPSFDFTEYLKSAESRTHSQDRVTYEYESHETIIFNRRQQEIEHKIESIRIELKKLATEIVHLDKSTQSAIKQEFVNPGTYHLSFFEKLLTFLQYLRKRVVESRNWAALQYQRNQSQSYYWHNANQKVGGTKFSLSHERTMATQTG